jgi:hypothetical protein
MDRVAISIEYFDTESRVRRCECWRPRCLHMSRKRSVSMARQASMTMAVLSPRP